VSLQQLNELDLENLGSWPGWVKALFISIFCALLGGGFYYYVISGTIDRLASERAKEPELRQQLESKAALAANLEQYQQQMEEMRGLFVGLLQQLPASNEIAGLLDDISFIGTDNGLRFKTIHWQPEVEHEFSTELPMRIEVSGDYHQLGEFAADIAALPRIVTLHNFTIERHSDDDLSMKMVAKTYRYKERTAP